MKLTFDSLEWGIKFDLYPMGWTFEVTHPNLKESITNGAFYPLLDTAASKAEALIYVLECQLRINRWLEVQRNAGLSQSVYESGISLAANLTDLVALTESDQTRH